MIFFTLRVDLSNRRSSKASLLRLIPYGTSLLVGNLGGSGMGLRGTYKAFNREELDWHALRVAQQLPVHIPRFVVMPTVPLA